MTERTTTRAQVPMFDPACNYYLTPEGRPTHSPTSIAPRALLSHTGKVSDDTFLERFESVAAELELQLGRPFYAKHGFILYKGDCLDQMRRLTASRSDVALTVTSPPYNIGKPYETPRDIDDYLTWCETWLAAIHGLTSRQGALWLNLGYLEVPEQGLCVPISYLLWNRTPFYLLQEVVWHYEAGVATRNRFCPRNEKWLFYVRDRSCYTFNLDDVRDPNVKYPNQKKNGKLRCNPLGKNPSDVWAFPKVTTGEKRSSKERTGHPAQFPLGVVDRIVKVSSNAHDIVMDPFSGSGSTGIVAVGNNRVYLGFEIREDYCRLSIERFERFIEARCKGNSQGSLFTDE